MPHRFPYRLTTEFNLLHNSFSLSQLAFALSIGQQCPSPPAVYKQEGGLSDGPISLWQLKLRLSLVVPIIYPALRTAEAPWSSGSIMVHITSQYRATQMQLISA